LRFVGEGANPLPVGGSRRVIGVADPTSLALYRDATVMVTGGLGFIGSNLARRLVQLGAKVIVVDAMIPHLGGNLANLSDLQGQLQIQFLNLSDATSLAVLVPDCKFIFNLAGNVSHLDSMHDPITDLESNVRAQIVLLETCRRHAPEAKIAFASTRQIYGRPDYLPVDEAHPRRPVDVNGINKMAAEAYHTLYTQVYGLKTVSLRLTNTFGPRMRIKDARQTFLGIWIRCVVEDGEFEVWGGEQQRDLTYVDDVVEAFLLAAADPRTDGAVYNIGGGPPVTLSDLAAALLTAAGSGRCAIKAFPAERKRIDIGDYFADDRKFRNLTGWAPRVSLAEGLERAVAYYRDHLGAYV
jgi:UDP-glucose 4-epimerase